MKKVNHVRAAIAMAAVLGSTAALAATAPTPVQLYGGGATLPANAYIGFSWLTTNPPLRRSDTQPLSLTYTGQVDTAVADANSLFAAMELDKSHPAHVSYCQTGSGAGRKVLLGTPLVTGGDATGACSDYGTSSPAPAGFSAALALPDFAASDAPFSASEVTTFESRNTPAVLDPVTNAVITPAGATNGRGYPVQMPAVAGAIAIVYHNAEQTTQLNLTESQICQIFAGQLTTWGQLNSAVATPSKPITLVVRSDGSGTSFNFTNHLSAVCPTAIPVSVPATTGAPVFVTESTFTHGLPAGVIASSGNGGVVNSVLATDGAIGYAELADASARSTLAGGGVLKWATVTERPDIAAGLDPVTGAKIKAQKFKKWDPMLNLPKSIAVNPIANVLIGSSNDANGRPVLVAPAGYTATVDASGKVTGATVTTAPDPVTGLPVPVDANAAAATGCIQTVDPNSIAIPTLKKGDYTQYPIVAVSYLMGYNTGNVAANKGAVQDLFASAYKIPSKVKSIGAKTGFAALSVKAPNPAGNPKAIPGAKMGDIARACLN